VEITIQAVTRRFGEVTAINAVDLHIQDGELFFLLGPSGSGKTTLLRLLGGFDRPDAGRILFDDQDVTDLPPHRRPTAMVFQGYALWPHMTVLQNVTFGLEMQRLPAGQLRERALDALDLVHIRDLADRRPQQLSGGQQQRVALARALVVRPQVLLLDEPLANLDARLRIEMRREIRRLCKESGLTAVYVTHDQQEALSMADRMAVLDAGRVLQIGTPREVYTEPSSAFVAEFLGDANLVRGVIDAVYEDRCEVRTDFGVLSVVGAGARSMAVGDEVTVCFRPEVVRLESADSGAAHAPKTNAAPGRIIERTYLGELGKYRLQMAGDVVLSAAEVPPHVPRSAEREWTVVIPPEEVRLFPRT